MSRTNEIIEYNNGWLLVDISTEKFPNAKMAVDSDVWRKYIGVSVWATCGNQHKYIRSQCNLNGKKCLFHRQILRVSETGQVDHIKHGTMDFIDNRRSNLRVVTPSQNSQNRGLRSNNTSGIVGVYWNKRDMKWVANIRINGSGKHLGTYDNIEFAIEARKQAEREYFGEFTYDAV